MLRRVEWRDPGGEQKGCIARTKLPLAQFSATLEQRYPAVLNAFEREEFDLCKQRVVADSVSPTYLPHVCQTQICSLPSPAPAHRGTT